MDLELAIKMWLYVSKLRLICIKNFGSWSGSLWIDGYTNKNQFFNWFSEGSMYTADIIEELASPEVCVIS